ncbi:MAG TPA: hypothetical protein VN956_26470 [Pyrinomonadaceae bacterium]|nr:hypothetical protein [Pyrinomonadaceae bacterium]
MTSVSHRLNELLSGLKWSGSTDLSKSELVSLQNWLEQFFLVLLTEPQIKQYFRFLEKRIEPDEIKRAVAFCVTNLEIDHHSYEEPEYFGSFYLVTSHIRALAERACSDKKRIRWKDLEKLILSSSEISRFSPFTEVMDDITNISDRRQEDDQYPKEEELVPDFHEGALTEIAAINSAYETLKSTGSVLPKLQRIVGVIREELVRGDLDPSKPWIEIWTLVRRRRKELDYVDLARGEAFRAVMTGELSSEEREVVLACLKLMVDSAVPGTDRPLLSLDEEVYADDDPDAKVTASDVLSTLLELIRKPNKDLETADDQYLLEQFTDSCGVWKVRPVTAIANSFAFIDQGLTGPFEPNANALRIILGLTLITAKPSRNGLFEQIDKYLEYQYAVETKGRKPSKPIRKRRSRTDKR